jgi:hypothetical protein
MGKELITEDIKTALREAFKELRMKIKGLFMLSN